MLNYILGILYFQNKLFPLLSSTLRRQLSSESLKEPNRPAEIKGVAYD